MKIAVTGATGFLGGWVVKRLLKAGHGVSAVGRNVKQGEELQSLRGDLKDPLFTASVCAGQDYVVHCAALSSPWGSYSAFYEANVKGTENVISACTQAKVKRLIHISTPSLYVESRDRSQISESEPLPIKSVNDYAATKRIAESRIDAAHANGLPVITLRPQGIFGPGDLTIIPRLLKAARRGVLPVIGSADHYTDLTYVENVVDAILLCLDSPPETLGQKYNITNGEPVILYSLIDHLTSRLGIVYKKKKISLRHAYIAASCIETVHRLFFKNREPILTRYTVSVLGRTRTLSIEKAKTELGYIPRVSIAEGLDRLIVSLT